MLKIGHKASNSKIMGCITEKTFFNKKKKQNNVYVLYEWYSKVVSADYCN